jgi:hypothetical protein
MPELERALAALGAEIVYPATPDLAAAVGARLRPRRPAWVRFALAAAIALALLGASLFAWTPARDTVAGWLGVRGVGVERVPKLPPVPSPAAGSFGTEMTVAAASSEAGFPVRQASGLGAPAVFVAQVPPGREVALVYQTGGGEVVLTEIAGTLQEYSFMKLVGPDTVIQPVSVRGHNAWWLSGHPHAFFYLDSHGGPQTATLRLATNTLAWEEDGVIYRLEGASLTQSQALQIAAGLY